MSWIDDPVLMMIRWASAGSGSFPSPSSRSLPCSCLAARLQAPYVVVLQRTSLLLSIIGGRVLFQEGDFGGRLAAKVLIVVGVGLVVWLQVLVRGRAGDGDL